MRKGFTLLEVLVAMSIFGVVVSAAYSLFHASRAVQSRAEARAELFQAARAALRAIEDDLRGAVLSGSVFDTGLIGTSRGSAEQPEDKIEILAVNQQPGSSKDDVRIDLSKVTYWISDGSQTKTRGLVRERQKALTAKTVYAGRDENVEEIGPEVVGLDLRYYDTQWQETWDSTKQYKLPKAIEAAILIRGEWRGQEFVERFSTRFYLPIAAETPQKLPQ